MYSCAHRQISTEDDAITPDSIYCVCRAVEPCSDHAYIHTYIHSLWSWSHEFVLSAAIQYFYTAIVIILHDT